MKAHPNRFIGFARTASLATILTIMPLVSGNFGCSQSREAGNMGNGSVMVERRDGPDSTKIKLGNVVPSKISDLDSLEKKINERYKGFTDMITPNIDPLRSAYEDPTKVKLKGVEGYNAEQMYIDTILIIGIIEKVRKKEDITDQYNKLKTEINKYDLHEHDTFMELNRILGK